MTREEGGRRKLTAGLALLLTTAAQATRSGPNLRNGPADSDGRGRRDLPARAYCGSSWRDAFDTCDRECERGGDDACGPGRYCFGHVDCTLGVGDEDKDGTIEEDPYVAEESSMSMSMPAASSDFSTTWTVDEIDAENNPELAKEMSGDEEEYGTIEPWEAIAIYQ